MPGQPLANVENSLCKSAPLQALKLRFSLIGLKGVENRYKADCAIRFLVEHTELEAQ
jgi:hypothetical protein